MTTPLSVTLDGVAWHTPDGRCLFSNLNAQFDARPTGLVGRNGVGKSVLAQLLAGLREPSAGQCRRIGRVHYLAQQVAASNGQRVAALAAVDNVVDALRRIENGSSQQADFDAVGEQWTLREELQQALADAGLHGVAVDTPVDNLSGGQRMRVALVGALLQPAQWLILDEPSNHLDLAGRQWLAQQLQKRGQGVLLVSHDRLLLEQVERIVELSPQGLRSHGGNYSSYAQVRAMERAAAEALLQQRRHERRKGEHALREQQQRLEQRSARGRREAAHANQAPILLGLQRQRAEASLGKARQQLEQRHDVLHDAVRQAQAQMEQAAPVLLPPPPQKAAPEWVAQLQQVHLPHVAAPLQLLDIALRRGERVAVSGINGAGKSTLLKVLARQLAPLSGDVQVQVPAALLDQQLELLPADLSAVEGLRAHNRSMEEGELRSRLSLLGLDAVQAQLPSAQLSGGQRLKAALACALYADPPAQLLLLDEPGNHLDLEALAALESVLQQYSGTLVVVSHDEAFLQAVGITARLQATAEGWRWQ
ncbi:ATP-binding cassette domain-containing protein [Stenotrophomonas sp. SY1]|uniref:ATP-binding cassette domain-containing protein n=1 Tax=Stenotrophomonas sp. SY1 TaxID=477235 RepID=UPI001E642D57|nr:ATP-binding cassette domain-containing protein [Stenotrophomonas sp. SY1]MCD9085177.1 ATP-binding cassette domain-containing protein [Stenotrophomonas sp. SY1]